jgi:putative transposase
MAACAAPWTAAALLPLLGGSLAAAGCEHAAALSKAFRNPTTTGHRRQQGWLGKAAAGLPQSRVAFVLSGVICKHTLVTRHMTPAAPIVLPTDDQCAKGTRDWPHAPPHRLGASGVYFVTARTAEQRHLFDTTARLDWFMQVLFDCFAEKGWKLEAWAILSNHYHIIAHSPAGDARTLRPLLKKLHSLCTKRINVEDGTKGRERLWQNFRETHLTHQESYLARLNYVHQNPRHHGVVALASQWKWCSASAFKRAASPAWVKTIASFKFDQIAKADGD